MFGHPPLDLLDRDGVPLLLLQNILQEMFHDFVSQLFAAERGKGGDAHERAFLPADVCANAGGQEIAGLVAQVNTAGMRFLPQDRHACLNIGRWELGRESPLETGNESMLEIRNLGGRAVARENNLFMAIEEGVEGVEKLFLRALLASEKLDVIDQKQVRLSIAFAKLNQIVVLNCVDKLVDKKFARKVHHLRVFLFHPNVLTDRLHQMRLAEPDSAVNEER